MGTGLLVATDDPVGVAATLGEHDGRLVRWPDDGPRLIEQHWDRIGPCLDALTQHTGVRRISADEAAAVPGISTIAAMLTLNGHGKVDGGAEPDSGGTSDGARSRLVLVADPASLTGFVSTVSNLSYGQRRVLPMPLDILASMNRKLRGVAAMGSALSISGSLLAQFRTRGRWAALVDAAGERAQHAARHLSLAGIGVLPRDCIVESALAGPGAQPLGQWLSIEQRGDEYLLLVRAPGLAKDAMILSRAGDDLLVTVDGIAHPIELPSGLKRCAVIGGSVTEDGVHIRFRPERGKWRA